MICAFSLSIILKSFVPFSCPQILSSKVSEREKMISIKDSLSYFDINSEHSKN